MSTLIAAPFPALSELNVVPLPEVENWFDQQEYSHGVSVSTSLQALTPASSIAPNSLHRHSSIFPNFGVSAVLSMSGDKRSSAADLASHGPQIPCSISLDSSKSSLVEEEASGSSFDQFHHTTTTATAHLSPFSDASTPSDLEHPNSPFSPHQYPPTQACCADLSAGYPSTVMGANDESDSRSSSPSLASDDELSQINQNLQEERLDTPPFTPCIAPPEFPPLALNVTTIEVKTANTNLSSAAATHCSKSEVPAKAGKSKRSRRRNLIRALKEQTGDGNQSGSEGEPMNAQVSAQPTRAKRSYIALLGDEGKVVDDEEEDSKAASGTKRDRNKASASAYRKRRKIYLDTLEARVNSLNDRLKSKEEMMTKMESENRVLREQVSFLKRLINFKASDEEELKEASNAMTTTSTAPQASNSSSSSSSSFPSGVFSGPTSHLSFGHFNGSGNRHASVFLFLLFCCFLLFNPLWTGMDLSGGLSDASSAGSMPLAMGRAGRSLLSYDAIPSSVSAPHPFLLSSAVVNEVNEAAQVQFMEEQVAKESAAQPSIKQEQNTTATAAPLSSSSSSSSSVTSIPSEHSKAWQALTEFAQHFDMDPTSPQFAELVASAYLPLVSILGEAATQAALRDLASGVFFIQHHALLQAAMTHSAGPNATTVTK